MHQSPPTTTGRLTAPAQKSPGRVFEFVTEAALTRRRGGSPVRWTIVHRYEIATTDTGSRVSYRIRVTRISHLVGPLRMRRTPLAAVLRKAWATFARKGLRNLVAVAETASRG